MRPRRVRARHHLIDLGRPVLRGDRVGDRSGEVVGAAGRRLERGEPGQGESRGEFRQRLAGRHRHVDCFPVDGGDPAGPEVAGGDFLGRTLGQNRHRHPIDRGRSILGGDGEVHRSGEIIDAAWRGFDGGPVGNLDCRREFVRRRAPEHFQGDVGACNLGGAKFAEIQAEDCLVRTLGRGRLVVHQLEAVDDDLAALAFNC